MDLWTSPTDRREPCGPCGQPVDNADALPTACPHSRASRPQAPQDQSPVILTRQHRTTLRRGCLHRPFRTTSASHSNPSQHRPRPSSPPILQAHFRMGLDSCVRRWRDHAHLHSSVRQWNTPWRPVRFSGATSVRSRAFRPPSGHKQTTGFLSEGYRVGSTCALGFCVYAPSSVAKPLLLDRLPARAGGQVSSPTLRTLTLGTYFKGCRMRRRFAQLS